MATLAVLALAPATARAQVALGARVGVQFTSALVHDSVVEAITVQVKPAPVLGLSIDGPVGHTFTIVGGIAVSRSDVVAHAASGDNPLTPLTVWHPTLAVRRPFLPWLSVEARIGALIYAPSDGTANLFQDGAPVDVSLGAGVQVEHRLGADFAAGLSLQYDATRFTTQTLENQGFVGATVVHRVALAATIRRLISTGERHATAP